MNKTTTKNLISNVLGILAISALSIMFIMPSSANAGFYTAGSGASAPIDPPTPTPVPVIYSISPNSVNTSANTQNYDTNITVTGANFIYGSVVRFNNTDKTTTFVNSNKLTAVLTASDMANVGAFSITVFNPGPNTEVSNALLLYLNRTSTTTTVTTSSTAKKTTITPTSSTSNNANNSNNSLAANAIFGTTGLMPTSLMGWILLLTLVLLIVIFARKAFFEEKNKSVPLKHH